VTDDELVARFAGHPVDLDSAAHYRGRLDRRLVMNRCAACGHWHHPPRPICPACWSEAVAPSDVAGDGTIHLAIFLHRGPPAPGVSYHPPYPVVTVQLDEQDGLRFTATVLGAPDGEIEIGRRVRLDWTERGGVPVPAFRLSGTGP
jgi:uncharacterized OB-fold protein